MPSQARPFFEQLLAAMMKPDREALEKLVHPDFMGDFPQSGERARGFAQFWGQLEAYPGGAPGDVDALPGMRVVGDEERWAMSPGYSVVPLADPTRFTIVGSVVYPDGVRWHIIMSVELRDGRLFRSETYFGPEMAAPIAESIAARSRG